MGDLTDTRTSRHSRRAVLARVLAVAVGGLLLGLVAPSAAMADAVITNISVSGSGVGGDNAVLTAALSGDCGLIDVTFQFQGGPTTTVKATGNGGECVATTTRKYPVPSTCPGNPGQETAVAFIAGGIAVTQPVTVSCPPPKPTPTPTKATPKPKPTKSASRTPTPTPTPTATPTATANVGASSPPPSSKPPSSPRTETKPAKDQPTVARQAALLVPVDDGGPQPPEPDQGRTPIQQLAAASLLLAGGVTTALMWQRGATRAVVGGVVAGTLVLASAPLVVPTLTSEDAAPSTAVRIRPATVDVEVKASETATANAQCPAGTVLVGGGVRTSGDGSHAVVVSASQPTAGGWTSTATAPADASVTLTAVALCTTDVGVTTSPASGLAASLSQGDTSRTQARCASGSPLALGWSGTGAPAVAGLPLRDGATVIAWGERDVATSITNVLCTAPGSTAWPVRYDSEQVQISTGATGSADAECPAGSQSVGGGYVAAANVGGRVAPVTVMTAAPQEGAFHVEVTAAGTSSGVLLTAYALCLPVY